MTIQDAPCVADAHLKISTQGIKGVPPESPECLENELQGQALKDAVREVINDTVASAAKTHQRKKQAVADLKRYYAINKKKNAS